MIVLIWVSTVCCSLGVEFSVFGKFVGGNIINIVSKYTNLVVPSESLV